jgi:hypothetical protein
LLLWSDDTSIRRPCHSASVRRKSANAGVSFAEKSATVRKHQLWTYMD